MLAPQLLQILYFSVFAPATINASVQSSMSLKRQGLLGWGDVKDRTHSVLRTLLHSSVSSSFFGPRSCKSKCEFLQEVLSQNNARTISSHVAAINHVRIHCSNVQHPVEHVERPPFCFPAARIEGTHLMQGVYPSFFYCCSTLQSLAFHFPLGLVDGAWKTRIERFSSFSCLAHTTLKEYCRSKEKHCSALNDFRRRQFLRANTVCCCVMCPRSSSQSYPSDLLPAPRK